MIVPGVTVYFIISIDTREAYIILDGKGYCMALERFFGGQTCARERYIHVHSNQPELSTSALRSKRH